MAAWGSTVPYYLKIKNKTQLRNNIFYRMMDIIPQRNVTKPELTAMAQSLLSDKCVSQLIYLILNPVLLTHMIIERLTDPDSDGATRYQFPPEIPMRGFNTLEELETFDRTIYNIHTGEKQSLPVWMAWRPRHVPLSEVEVTIDTNHQNRQDGPNIN